MQDSYYDFARFYDSLMEDARYGDRAAYLLAICERFGHPIGVCLDLACGTASLTRELFVRGIEVLGVDGSVEMLAEASRRSIEENCEIPFICQDIHNDRIGLSVCMAGYSLIIAPEKNRK